MKQCAICDEQLDDHVIKCSKGHSLFKPVRGKQPLQLSSFPGELQIVEDMLRHGSVDYTEDEIAYLTVEITRICRDSRTRITKDLVETIGKNIKERQKLRLEAEAEQKKVEEVRQLQQRRESEQRERLMSVRQPLLQHAGGVNDRLVHPDDLTSLLGDALSVALYSRLQAQYNPDATEFIDHAYKRNDSFWYDAHNDRLAQGMRIELNRFHVMEWIPAAPGRYFTPEADNARERARYHVDFSRREFLPLGKQEMVLGGIGSVRLGAKDIGRDEVYPLCASSTGISHEGIPVILTDRMYRQVMDPLHTDGGCLVDLIGHLKIIPRRDLPIDYDANTKRFFLLVDHLEALGPSERTLATIAITFSGSERMEHKMWSFCSFEPRQQHLHEAVAWLRDYTLRHSYISRPLILGDFDEHYQHFDNPVEFPIAQVARGRIDYRELTRYQQALHFTINIGEYVMGDQYNFQGATVTTIGGQQFIGRFNETIANLNAAGHQEFGQALAELTDAVAKSSHLSDEQKREQLELVQELGEEATKAQPNKSRLRSLGNGLKEALQAVPDVAKAVIALAPFLAKMMT